MESSEINFIISLLVYTNLILLSKASIKTEEYCSSETFAPRCERNQILIIDNAIYGRKKIGRCLMDEDPSEGNLIDSRFIGCYSDVKHIVMQKCFGKQDCDLRIAEIKASTTCYKYLKLYLDVSHYCVTVVQPAGHCTITITHEKQFIFGPQKSSCGSQQRPWTIETMAGQKISLHGINFIENVSSKMESFSCRNIGQIIEKTPENSNTPICLNLDQQETMIYRSKSNQIEIYFNEINGGKDNYLISVEATGCSDLIPPADAWLKRTENEATIGCYSTRLRWQLKCVGQRWIGVIGNCSYGHSFDHVSHVDVNDVKPTDNTMSIIFMIVVAGFVLCLLIGCLGVVCLKRYYSMNKMKGLKHMNGIMNDTQLFYNSQSLYPGKHSIEQNGHQNSDQQSLTNIDAVQYFELDHNLVANEESTK